MSKIKSFITFFLFCFAMTNMIYGMETATIIKVSGPYGIINKGINQGLKEGQIFYVKRDGVNQLASVVQVKVIRTTANRAAVEQISKRNKSLLIKGDKLFANNQNEANIIERIPKIIPPRPKNPTKQSSVKSSFNDASTKRINPKNDFVRPNSRMYYVNNSKLRNPWIGLNLGSIFPFGDLANLYSPSFKFGASYMVSAGRSFNLGVEVNKTFFGKAGFENSNVAGLNSIASSSILEVFVVFQKYFGNNFFVETGGGIFRPKIRTISIDNFESTYSKSNFGIFGGTGILVPTSEYAGFILKGRLHNYFDQKNKQYFGLTGGFRFKIQ